MVEYQSTKRSTRQERAKIFARIIKEITIAVKETAIMETRNQSSTPHCPAKRTCGANMPKDNIEEL